MKKTSVSVCLCMSRHVSLDYHSVAKERMLDIDYFRQMCVPQSAGVRGARRRSPSARSEVGDVRQAHGTHKLTLMAKPTKTCNAPEFFATTSAYFHATASWNVYIKLPTEEPVPVEKHLCRELMKAMCGSSGVAQKRHNTCSEVAMELEFTTEQESPCHFHHGTACGIVHGDIVVFAWRKEYLQKISEYMATEFNIKAALARRGEPNVLRVFSRSIREARTACKKEGEDGLQEGGRERRQWR